MFIKTTFKDSKIFRKLKLCIKIQYIPISLNITKFTNFR